jgi:hypothetical protein
MVGTTVDSLVERARRDTLLASRGPLHTLNGAHTSTTTTLLLNETPTHIGVGEMIAADYELMYVQQVQSTANSVTVIRGYFGSTAATHAANTITEVAPRIPRNALLDYAYHEIASWERKLWRTTTVDLAVTAGQTHYPLDTITGRVFHLLDVRMDPVETNSTWWNWSWVGDRHARAGARLIRHLDAANPDEVALQFTRRPLSTTNVRVTVAQPLNLAAFTGATDLITDVGLRIDWLDLLETGMKWRALTGSVLGRTDWRTMNVARTAEEVTPLDVVRAAGHLRDLRTAKLSDAAVALIGEWPWREQ